MSVSVSFNETAGFSKSIFFCFSRASDEWLPKKNENNVSAANFSVRRNSNYITTQLSGFNKVQKASHLDLKTRLNLWSRSWSTSACFSVGADCSVSSLYRT